MPPQIPRRTLQAAPPASLPSLDILVAEDDAINRLYLGSLLSSAGHRVRFADSGEEALGEARRALPDLILMDLHMPGMGGLQAARALRADPPPLNAVKIVALTADVFGAPREQAHAAGMDDFLGKPFRWDDMERLLLRLHGRPAAAANGGQAHAPLRTRPATVPIGPGDMTRHLALESIGELCVLVSLDGYRPLVAAFFDDSDDLLGRLCKALAQADAASVIKLAHQAKGAADLLGLKAIAARASAVEDAAESLCRPDPPGRADARTKATEQLRQAWETSRALCRCMGFIP